MQPVAWHMVGATQTVPQPWQLLLSVATFVHAPPQQLGVAPVHAVPHLPQLFGSVDVVTHAEPQAT